MDEYKDYILKLLEWPFLLLVGVGAFIFVFKKEIGKVLSRGGVTLTWGDKSFELSELPEQLNESFAPVSDDIEDLKNRISELESIVNKEAKTAAPLELKEGEREVVRQKMLEALESGKYRWRSIERLATIGGVSLEEANSLLRGMNEVVFSRGKSGRTIARLKDN